MTTLATQPDATPCGAATQTPQRAPALLPAAAEMLRELRGELTRMLASIAAIPAPHPVRIVRNDQSQSETRIWHDGPTLCVPTCHGGDDAPSLHIAAQEGARGWPKIETMPDWTTIGTDEAFDIASALLGAVLAVHEGVPA